MRPATSKQIALGDAYPGKVKLEDRIVAELLPTGRYIRDAKVNRLLLRVGPRKRVWLLRAGRERKIKLGEWPAMSTEEAREAALALIGGR